MKKSDLKSGMVVELRSGERFIFVDNKLLSIKHWMELEVYNDDLLIVDRVGLESLDIMKIYESKNTSLISLLGEKKLVLVWEREEDNNSIYEDYREAAKYNEDLCTTIAMEECAELIQAISKAKRGKLDKDNLAEEIADVMICMDWIVQIYGISGIDIDKWFKLKEKRIVDRLNTGEFK